MSNFGWVDGAQKFTSIGATTASSVGTTVTAPGSTNTKGSWTQIVSSTSHHAAGLMLSLYFTAPSGAGYGLVDIGVGGSGSEVVLIPDIMVMRLSSQPYSSAPILFPVTVPSGTRISARYAASQTGATCIVSGQLIGPTLNYPILAGECETIGSVSATSKGTQVDPGGTANTKGSWAQLTASTSRACRWAMVSITHDAPSTLGGNWLVDIGVGAASSETVVVPNMHIFGNTVAGVTVQRAFIPLAIPSGTRVSARAQCDSATTGTRQLLVNMHLFG